MPQTTYARTRRGHGTLIFMKRLLPFLLAAALALPATAQTARTVGSLQLWPEAQAELALPGNNYLLLALRGQNNTGNNACR